MLWNHVSSKNKDDDDNGVEKVGTSEDESKDTPISGKLLADVSLEELEWEMKRLRRTIDREETTKHIFVTGISFLGSILLIVRQPRVMIDFS